MSADGARITGAAPAIWVPASCRVRTPAKLANAIVAALADGAGRRWLEPAAAEGVFLTAVHKLDRAHIATGVELELGAWGSGIAGGVEFLDWSQSIGDRFDVVVGNPPYARLSRVSVPVRVAAAALPVPEGAAAASGRANLWYAFILAGLSVLKKGGSMAWVLPAAWEYADYAHALRERLPRMFGSVLEIRSRAPLCPGVEDAAVVLIARRFGEAGSGIATRLVVDDLAGAVVAVNGSRLVPSPRTSAPIELVLQGSRPLGDFLAIEIGAVTGCSRYFLLSEARRLELRLPLTAVVPVLTRSRHLTSAVMGQAEWNALRDGGERVWLFRPGGALQNTGVRRYLALPGEAGGCDRAGYKIRNRDPWHTVPLPREPHVVLSAVVNHGIRLVVSNLRGLSATNTLYAATFRKPMSPQAAAALGLALLSTPVRAWLHHRARYYGGGLTKLEPTEMSTAPVPRHVVSDESEAHFARAVSALLAGDPSRASTIADATLILDPV